MDTILICFSAISFLGFGIACFLSRNMRREFTRYGLAVQRPVVGACQLAGAVGLLAGLAYPQLGQAAAAGLAILMLLGVIVRVRIRDTIMQTAPAFLYMVLNAYLLFAAFPGMASR